MQHWTGVLAYVDTPTIDDRILRSPQIIRARPLPLPLMTTGPEPRPIGAITSLTINGKELRAQGIIREGILQPGQKLPVGLDVDDVEHGQPDGPLTTFERWRVTGATAHPSGGAAFPDAHITLKQEKHP